MRRTDVKALSLVIRRMQTPESVLVFSPAWDSENVGLSERAVIDSVWPYTRIHECDKGRWNLNDPMPIDIPTCAMGIICNTFICSPDPSMWLQYISASVPILIMQDIAVSRRETDRHCSIITGDLSRYSIPSRGIIGKTDPDLQVFDLDACGYEIIDAERYDDGENVSFVAVIRLR